MWIHGGKDLKDSFLQAMQEILPKLLIIETIFPFVVSIIKDFQKFFIKRSVESF